jgi:multiple sugar transport system substrate-binding protein
MAHKRLSRRDFLRMSALGAAGMALAGCAAPTPETVTVKETVVVEKEVEKTVEVEKVVEVTAEAPELEPIELRIAWWGGDSRTTKTIAVLQMFEELYPHITMVYEFSGWDDHWTKLQTQAAGGNLPDIMQHDYARLSEWVASDLIMPLDEYVDSGVLDFSQVADANLAGGRIDGKLYGVNLGTNALDVGVAVDLFEQAGVDLPAPDWSWDDFEEICCALNDALGIWGYAGNTLAHDHMWKAVYLSLGEWVFTDDGKALGYEDDKPFIDHLYRIQRMEDTGAVQTYEERLAREPLGEEGTALVTGEGAMGFGWSNGIVATWTAAGADRNFTMFPIPRSGDLPAVYVKPSMFFSVTAHANYPKEAAMFINFFTNSVPANAILMADRGVPVAAHVKEGMKGFLEPAQVVMFDYLALVEGDSVPVPPPDPVGWADVRNNIFYPEFVDPVLYRQITPDEGAATFREMANEILAAS